MIPRIDKLTSKSNPNINSNSAIHDILMIDFGVKKIGWGHSISIETSSRYLIYVILLFSISFVNLF